jgi:hypothetical protein
LRHCQADGSVSLREERTTFRSETTIIFCGRGYLRDINAVSSEGSSNEAEKDKGKEDGLHFDLTDEIAHTAAFPSRLRSYSPTNPHTAVVSAVSVMCRLDCLSLTDIFIL